MESSRKILPPNTYWVLPGRFLAGEYPGDKNPEKAAERIKVWLDFGINHFIDLTEPGELESYHHLIPESDDITVKRFPIRDIQVPPKILMIQILNEIDDAIKNGKKVYVHCHGGIGRTGTVVGCYYARHGYEGEAALAKLEHVWDSCPKSSHAMSPETEEQCDYVMDWRE